MTDERESFNCTHCDGRPSFNKNDIKYRYCAHCRHFCDVVDEQEGRVFSPEALFADEGPCS